MNNNSWKNRGFAPNMTNKIAIAKKDYESRYITGKLTLDNATAANVDITDAGGYYTGTTVELALAEIGAGTTLDSRYVNVTGDTMTGALTVTAITSGGNIISDTDSTDDLGSSSKYWANAYADKLYLNATATIDGTTAAGLLNVTGNIGIRSSAELRFYDNGNYVGFEAPALSADQIWVLPTADGTADQVLKTDGSGALGWTDGGGAGTLAEVAAGSTDTAKSLYTMSSDVDVEFETSANATLLYLDESTGYVGIGTTGPSYPLHVNSGTTSIGFAVTNSAAVLMGVQRYADTNVGLNLGGQISAMQVSSGLTIFSNDINNTITSFRTSQVDRMVISGADKVGLGGAITNIPTLAGASMVINNGNVGIGTTGPLAKCHIDQATSDASLPVLALDQADISEGFVNYLGATAASAAGPISSWTAGNAIQGFVRVEINNTQYWMPYYNDPAS